MATRPPSDDPLTARTGLTSSERRLRGQIAAHSRWARGNTGNCGALGQAGLDRRFEREVDPDGTLTPAERAKRVEAKRREHFARMQLESALRRRLRAEGGRG